MSALRSLMRFAVLSIACAIIVLNGASHLYTEGAPRLALSINPFNTEAAVNLVVEGLAAEDAPGLDELRSRAAEAIHTAPGDARVYSALGGVLDREGDAQTAEQLYGLALERSKTEVYALLSLFSRSVARGEVVEALRYADLTLRRWPSYAGRILPLLTGVLNDTAGRDELARLLKSGPPWRRSVIGHLTGDAQGIAFVRDLILEEAGTGAVVNADETAAIINALVRAGAPAQAYQFFVLTLSEDQRDVAGYVHDASFTRAPNSRYFGWSYRPDATTDIAFPAPGGGLRVRFLDSPSRLGNVRQVLSLPPGDYDIQMIATASALRIPRGLYWQLNCAAGNAPLARLDVAPDAYERAGRVIGFTVPATGCPLQSLVLETGLRGDSWRDRYSGIVTFESVRIVRR